MYPYHLLSRKHKASDLSPVSPGCDEQHLSFKLSRLQLRALIDVSGKAGYLCPACKFVTLGVKRQ